MSRELWRSAYRKDAYADQTGMKHWGHVLLERVIVEDVGHWDQPDTYTGVAVPGLGILSKSADGRIFKGYLNTLDYYGGRHWIDEKGQFWKEPTKFLKGWVDEEGNSVRP